MIVNTGDYFKGRCGCIAKIIFSDSEEFICRWVSFAPHTDGSRIIGRNNRFVILKKDIKNKNIEIISEEDVNMLLLKQ